MKERLYTTFSGLLLYIFGWKGRKANTRAALAAILIGMALVPSALALFTYLADPVTDLPSANASVDWSNGELIAIHSHGHISTHDLDIGVVADDLFPRATLFIVAPNTTKVQTVRVKENMSFLIGDFAIQVVEINPFDKMVVLNIVSPQHYEND